MSSKPKTFRIFTNDRRAQGGVPMYSAFMNVRALSAEEALKKVPPRFDAPTVAPARAICWRGKTDADKAWLRKHVG